MSTSILGTWNVWWSNCFNLSSLASPFLGTLRSPFNDSDHPVILGWWSDCRLLLHWQTTQWLGWNFTGNGWKSEAGKLVAWKKNERLVVWYRDYTTQLYGDYNTLMLTAPFCSRGFGLWVEKVPKHRASQGMTGALGLICWLFFYGFFIWTCRCSHLKTRWWINRFNSEDLLEYLELLFFFAFFLPE